MTSHRSRSMKSSRCVAPTATYLLMCRQDHCYVHWHVQKPLQENQDLLIRCIAQHLGYAGNRPVAACIIYKCLLHWRSFEVERTSVFDRIIQTIGHAIEVAIMDSIFLTITYSAKVTSLHFFFVFFACACAMYVDTRQQRSPSILAFKCFDAAAAASTDIEGEWIHRYGSAASTVVFCYTLRTNDAGTCSYFKNSSSFLLLL